MCVIFGWLFLGFRHGIPCEARTVKTSCLQAACQQCSCWFSKVSMQPDPRILLECRVQRCTPISSLMPV